MQNRTNATDGQIKMNNSCVVMVADIMQVRKRDIVKNSVSYTQEEMIVKHLDVVNVRAVNPKVRFVYIMENSSKKYPILKTRDVPILIFRLRERKSGPRFCILTTFQKH